MIYAPPELTASTASECDQVCDGESSWTSPNTCICMRKLVVKTHVRGIMRSWKTTQRCRTVYVLQTRGLFSEVAMALACVNTRSMMSRRHAKPAPAGKKSPRTARRAKPACEAKTVLQEPPTRELSNGAPPVPTRRVECANNVPWELRITRRDRSSAPTVPQAPTRMRKALQRVKPVLQDHILRQ